MIALRDGGGGAGDGARYRHRKARTSAGSRGKFDSMLQQPGKATDDCQPQPHALPAVVLRHACTIELIENAIAVACRDADAGIDDVDPYLTIASAYAHHGAAVRGVVQCVADQVG